MASAKIYPVTMLRLVVFVPRFGDWAFAKGMLRFLLDESDFLSKEWTNVEDNIFANTRAE
jgi:hypothetical protein